MDGEPEPTKPDDKPTLLCAEEWCVACGNCDFPESHKAHGLWKTEEVLDECVECGEETEEPMWCDECEIEACCPACWEPCHCESYDADSGYDAMMDDIGSGN